ncbi:prefoldin [Aureococcus anophagefferens]|uniref:Prefoldin n=1 Tax=Aureococcus anophagefferens TaxID=44056 RepID=A0ABR1GEI3_AURAN
MAQQVAAAAPAPAPATVLDGEEKPMSEQDVIRIFKGFKRDSQMIISKISELEYEIGEHELVMANVETNMANIRATIDQLKKALENVNEKSKAWKEKYGIKTRQELDFDRAAQAAGGPAAPAAMGVLA